MCPPPGGADVYEPKPGYGAGEAAHFGGRDTGVPIPAAPGASRRVRSRIIRVRLIDFTFAARREADGKWRGAIVPGYGQYFPPEKILGSPADSTYDLYMAAGVAYYLLTGKAPFSGVGGDAGIAERRCGPDFGKIPDAGLAAVLRKAMSFNPEDRYRSSQAFLDALQPFC